MPDLIMSFEQATDFAIQIENMVTDVFREKNEKNYVMAIAALATALDNVSYYFGREPADTRKAILDVGPYVDEIVAEAKAEG